MPDRERDPAHHRVELPPAREDAGAVANVLFHRPALLEREGAGLAREPLEPADHPDVAHLRGEAEAISFLLILEHPERGRASRICEMFRLAQPGLLDDHSQGGEQLRREAWRTT